MTDKLALETFTPERLRHSVDGQPSVNNGAVNIRKYRVTIELVDEPVDILAERLRVLYDDPANGHIDNRSRMRDVAKELGVELK